VVRTVHGEFMWPFTARVNEKTAPIERIAAVAICRRLRDETMHQVLDMARGDGAKRLQFMVDPPSQIHASWANHSWNKLQ
jgi:hypothetical protein